jgi:signal transduction histidine kinase
LVSQSHITFLAPAQRASAADLERQARLFAEIPMLYQFIDTLPDILIVLNQHRQIVMANQRLLDFAGASDRQAVLGFRTGEVLGCARAFQADGGCGTSEFCQTCGTIEAILTSLEGRTDCQECRIWRRSEESLDLRVWAKPLTVGDERFSVFTIADISHEKRRQALERIFFHDLLNTAGNLQGIMEFLDETRAGRNGELEMAHRLSRELIEEIQAHKALNAAERGDLVVEMTPVATAEILRSVVHQYSHHELAGNRHLCFDDRSGNTILVSDPKLLRRVIGNLVRNALEASNPGQTITVGGAARDDKEVEFWVHNPGFIPPQVQRQIFQRSFSTKGAGRGLGTYSIKLLTERYLKGQVSFVSSPDQGTTFRLRYPLLPNI